jgi:DNA-directed RNA polymerase subunit RPC12/RpoP
MVYVCHKCHREVTPSEDTAWCKVSLLWRSDSVQDSPTCRQARKRRLILLYRNQGLYIKNIAIAKEPRKSKTIQSDISFLLVEYLTSIPPLLLGISYLIP